MKKILYINACARTESRTKKLAQMLLKKLGDYEEVDLETECPASMSRERLAERTRLQENGDLSDEIFRYATQFAAADIIVIATPYWDYSFPAVLKAYIENIYAVGIVSKYDENGIPEGLCRAEKLYYVTTAGGPYTPDFSYDYIRTLCTNCFGIKNTELIFAEMLDVYGYDAEVIIDVTAEKYGLK